MALNINGTTGISGVDGSASAPALTGTDSNTGINFASDTVNINTGGSTRATVDSTGRLLVGTTTGDPYGNRQLTVASSGTTTALELRSPTNGTGRIYFTDSTASGTGAYMASVQYDHTNNFMKFETNGGTERMRLDSSGRLLLGLTSTVGPTEGVFYLKGNTGSSGSISVFQTNGNALSGRDFIRFLNVSGGEAGSIEHSSTNAISFLTSSDYRLKENEVLISDGITRLKKLKPYKFNWKSDSSTIVDGFFAHEVSDAVPEAISGTKDQTKDILYTESDTIPSDKKVGDVKETVPDYQQIDQSKLVPLLTAALQEAVAKIEVLETKVAALEAG